MKKYVSVYLLFLFSLISCGPDTGPDIPITNPDMFPTLDLFGRFALMPHPTNSQETILGFVERGYNPKLSTFTALRDCWTNELISCVDSLGNLKESIVLCFNVEMETSWENVRSEHPIYESIEEKEYYVKIYISKRMSIDYVEQNIHWNIGDTLEIDMNDWRRYSLDFMVENKNQPIEIMGNQYPSYRALSISFNGNGR